VRVATGFDRPNLSFMVVPCRGDRERRVAPILNEPGALPAIVYAGTRKATDELAGRLSKELGVEALAYHAGLGREARASVQERFMGGDAPVVVATNAFGMGVDKADVRTVVHASVPGSLEAWYQEAGRAGRDGAPARCVLLAEPKDKALHVWFIRRGGVEDDEIQRALERVRRSAEDGRFDIALRDLVSGGDGSPEDRGRALLGHLARAGAVRLAPSPPDRAIGRVEAELDGRALALARSSAKEAERVRWAHYRSVWGWVEGRECRRAGVLRHFGDGASAGAAELSVPCCDVCAPEAVPGGAVQPAIPAAAAGDLDAAIMQVVDSAAPPVGRTRAVEILRGGRSKVVAEHSYDGLPNYGAYSHLRANDVMERVDALLEDGTLTSTGGRFPKLTAA
jgi:ATP-dependent DNA helicase RecQ